ncbi:hypothetical protein ACWCPE_01835 [Streptomyces nondiastaticus]|uniref:Uncharacterized protein n=1 Tax=Streptomyces nondiastaticus TaxID=3154512 RepID=A0ABW6TX69_9ACTN
MRRPAFTVTANGSYAARLALDGATGGWFPERWTLDGPEPYAVPLPGSQPEEPDSEVQPLADGRVLIRRRVAERHTLSLLYPTGPGTGELPVGAVECARLSLLPPAPGGASAYGLVHAERTTALWRLHGGAFGPERVVEVPGRCTGGAWLDRTGRLLALDRELDGRTKTVVVDLERGGETSPLLQITEDSNDRLLLADPYSGLLLVRSDAPGQDRLGWGVLGSARPVRFPECLRPAGAALTPFATQPGQELTPEGCAVAFRVEGATGSWVGVWRPSGKQLQQFPAPAGWLVGAGLWTSGGELRLPFVTPYVRCGLARLRLPEAERGETRDTGGRGAPAGAGGAADPAPPPAPGAPSAPAPLLQGVPRPEQTPAGGPQPLLQVPRTAPERPAPLLHEVPRPGLGQEQPLLQASPAAPRLHKASEPGPSGAGAPASPGAPQAPLLREAPQPVPPSQPIATAPPLLQEAPRPASPPPPRPEQAVAAPPRSPLPHEARPPVSPLLTRSEAPTAAPLPREAPRPASPPLPPQSTPLLHEVPRPVPSAPCPEPQVASMRDVPRVDALPQAGRPAHHEHATPQSAPLLHEVPRPEAAPLLERPHEGLSPGVPQAGPQGPVSMPPAGDTARAESPASVWTAVDPTASGLSGAAMPGAWSAAVSRPVPLQQAPLGREPRS